MSKDRYFDTKHLWDVKNSHLMGREEPQEITLLLVFEEYGKAQGNMCTLDYYVIGSGFEKRMTAYGRKRAKICSGGFNGCHGPTELNEFNEPLCKNCIIEMNKLNHLELPEESNYIKQPRKIDW